MKKRHITYDELIQRAEALSPQIGRADILYGVPRGGVAAAEIIAETLGCKITKDPCSASVIVDDLIDTGRTMDRFNKAFPSKPFIALIDKRQEYQGEWLVFPWELDEDGEDESAHDIFVRLLEYIGEDPNREGLKDTPKRMAKAWAEWTTGYDVNPHEFIKTFEDGAEQYDEMVLEKNIPFFSHCEHHLVPFFGTAHVAYIPQEGSVMGISKMARIVDMYARRLQIQERMTNQIAATIHDLIQPQGVAVVLEARHLCMESRGVKIQGQTTVTSAMLGAFRDNQAARIEFLNLIK